MAGGSASCLKRLVRIAALVATLRVMALVVTAPGVGAAQSGDDPVEVLMEGGDPFEAITAQATIGSTLGAALVNLVWGFLSLITPWLRRVGAVSQARASR